MLCCGVASIAKGKKREVLPNCLRGRAFLLFWGVFGSFNSIGYRPPPQSGTSCCPLGAPYSPACPPNRHIKNQSPS